MVRCGVQVNGAIVESYQRPWSLKSSFGGIANCCFWKTIFRADIEPILYPRCLCDIKEKEMQPHECTLLRTQGFVPKIAWPLNAEPWRDHSILPSSIFPHTSLVLRYLVESVSLREAGCPAFEAERLDGKIILRRFKSTTVPDQIRSLSSSILFP